MTRCMRSSTALPLLAAMHAMWLADCWRKEWALLPSSEHDVLLHERQRRINRNNAHSLGVVNWTWGFRQEKQVVPLGLLSERSSKLNLTGVFCLYNRKNSQVFLNCPPFTCTVGKLHTKGIPSPFSPRLSMVSHSTNNQRYNGHLVSQ